MNAKVSRNDLRAFVERVFQAAGVRREDAETAACVMIEANLCGVDSHGVRMLPGYVTLIRNGKINPGGRIRILKETPAIAHLDANLAMGSVAGVYAMNMAVDKAKTSGVGLAVVRNSTHWGRPAYYSALGARKECIGICFTNTEALMPAWGAREARVGNNPLTIGAPRESGEPIVLDMAMSQAAWGKIVIHHREGKKVPLGWGLDEQGQPTDDPGEILKSKHMLPTGQHKGSGLSFMIDIMTGILSGGKFCGELLEEAKGQPWATAYSQTFIALDISTFMPLEAFKKRVGELVAYVKSGQKAEGFSEINLPGERAWREKALRVSEGIPLDEVTLGELRKLAKDVGVPFELGS